MIKLSMDKAEFVSLMNEARERQGLAPMTNLGAEQAWQEWIEEMQASERYAGCF
jgi:hypothetical protein